MAQNYRKTLTKHRKVKKGRGSTKLERIEMDCIWVNLKHVGPPFFQIYVTSIYTCIKMSVTQLENHSQLLVPVILQMKDSWSANLTFRAYN